MIGLSTLIFDLQGARRFTRFELDQREVNKNNRRDRRITRTPTLDGGVSVYDAGYAPGDRDIMVRVPAPSKEIAEYLAYLCETYATIVVTTPESAFLGVPATSYLDEGGAANLLINVIEDLIT